METATPPPSATHTTTHPSHRRTLIAAIVVAALLIAAQAIIIWLVSDEELKTLLSDVLSPIANLLATGALFWAAKRSSLISRNLGRAWYLFASALLVYFLGDVTWSIIEVALHQEPFPSLADIFYLAYYPFLIIGVFILPRIRIIAQERTKLILDMVIIIFAVSLAYWVTLVGPLLHTGAEGTPLSLAISVAYPVLDMLLLFTLVSLLARPMSVQRQLPIYLLAGSAAIMALADSIYGYQSLIGTYISGSWLDLVWMIAYILAGLAGIVHGLNMQQDEISFEEMAPPRRLSLVWNLLPYLWMALSYLLLVWYHYQQESEDFVLLAWGVLLVGALVFLHQTLSTRENHRLYNDLQKEFEEHKRTTVELRENEARSRALSDLTTDYIYSARVFPDGKMKLEWASDAFQSIVGFTPAELEARGGWSTIVYPDDKNVFAHRSEAMRLGKAEVNEYRIFNKEGQIRWLRDYGRGELDKEGVLFRILGAAKDITDSKRTEQDLADSESRLRRFLNAIQAAILVTDSEGRPYMANDAARELLANHAISLDPPKRLAEFYQFYLAGSDQLSPVNRLPMFKAMWGEISKADDIEIEKAGKRVRLKIQSIPILDKASGKKVEYIVTTFE